MPSTRRGAPRIRIAVVGALIAGSAACKEDGGSPRSQPTSAAPAAPRPADRQTTWRPGIPGGVPARTAVCATISAAAHGNGATDASGAIQSALDQCPADQVVALTAGDFLIAHGLEVTKGVVLRGQGPGQTRLRMPPGAESNVVTLGQKWFPGYAQTVSLASDAVKGSQSVTLSRNPGLQAGEIVTIDQLHDPEISRWVDGSATGDPSHSWFTRPERPLGQVMEVASVNGNTVSFTTPFHIGFRAAQGAQLSRMARDGETTPVVRNAGLEDLSVSAGGTGQGNIWVHAAYSWVKNVESSLNDGGSISLDGAFRCVVRDSFIHTTRAPRPGGGGYGITFAFYSSDNLIENNVVWNMNKVMVMRATGGGNVIGYNYMDDGWIEDSPGWVEVGLNASHGATPHFELFEGNQSFNFDGDNNWGNAVYITVFRNHLTGRRRGAPPLRLTDQGNRRAVGLHAGHWWYTFTGNVLGSPGQDPEPYGSFTYEDTFPWGDDPVPMWRLGYGANDSWETPADPKVASTVLREGNFDYATNSVRWDTAPQALPSSLYLDAKPAFFGNEVWPWVDPSGATKVHRLPARARFEARMASAAAPPPPR